MIFIGQDGTRYVFDAASVEITARGKKVFANGTLVGEYLDESDANEAADMIRDEIDAGNDECLVPVKHFQGEPFVEFSWACEDIHKFLELVRKLPRDFTDEFCRVYGLEGREYACELAEKVTAYACAFDEELGVQINSEEKKS